MGKHEPHRKAAVHKKVITSRKVWRKLIKLDKLFIEIEIKRKK